MVLSKLHYYLRTRDVDQIGFEPLQDPRALHFGQIHGQGNLVVQGEGKPERVGDFVSKGLTGKIFGGCFGIHSQYLDFVTGLGKILQHFVEPVGVSRDMRERSGFHHETDLARRIAFQGRCIVR
jgi:hypothetical protein